MCYNLIVSFETISKKVKNMIYSLIPNIENNPLFANVSLEYIKKYINEDTVKVTELPSDTLAYSSESEQLQVAFILSGVARVYTGTGNENALMRTLQAGDIFGIANLYDDGEPFPSRIFTAANTSILFIPALKFKEFIENDPQATKNYMCFLSKKIVYLNKKLATLTAGSAERKLSAYICEHQVQGRLTVSSMSELADILQMGRASLYRSVDILIENKLIEKRGKDFIIINETKLKNM